MIAARRKTAIIFVALALVLSGLVVFAPHQALAADAAVAAASTAKVVKPAKAKISSLKSTAAGKATVKVGKVAAAKGYQFKVGTNKAVTKNVKQKVTTKLTHTFAKLIEGKKYFAKVRDYKKVNGKIVWGAWSAVKYVTVKKAVTTKNSPMAGTWTLVSAKTTDKTVSATEMQQANALGMYVDLTLAKDGKFTLKGMGETLSGTWKALSASKSSLTADGLTVTITLKSGKLAIVDDGISATFTKK